MPFVFQCVPLRSHLIRWKQISKKGSRLIGATCHKRLPTAVCGSYQSHPYSVCGVTLTLTPAHLFLMSNHHLTGAQDRHERQLITHGKSASLSRMIRHKKYLGDKCSSKIIFTITKQALDIKSKV